MKTNHYELLYMIRMGNEQAMKELVGEYTQIIEIQAKCCIQYYEYYQVYYEDLIETGFAALRHAVHSFREDREASFPTYAMLVIRRYMWNVLRSYSHNSNAFCEPHNLVYYEQSSDEERPSRSPAVCCDASSDPAYACRYQEAKERLDREMEKLTANEKAIYEGLLNGESRNAIMQRLGCSAKAYDGRLRRMRAKARRAVWGSDEFSAR